MSKDIFERIKNNLYLILPIFCIGLWLLFNLIHANFTPFENDFTNFYLGGQRVLTNPTELYKPMGKYTYMPVFGVIFSVSISLLPHNTAQYLFYFVNWLLGALFTLEYNKVLTLKNVEKKSHRFLFLIIISNGMIVYGIFYQNQFKYIIGIIFLFIIRREIQYRKEEKEKNLNYYVINFGLFAFAVAIAPYFIFLLIVYVFQDISFNQVLKWDSLKKYIIVISWFIIQNFLFILYPSLIFDFLSLYSVATSEGFTFLFYLREWISLNEYSLIVNSILIIIIAVFTLILIMNKEIEIEKKFIFSSLLYIIFYIYGGRTLILLLPISLLFLIPHLNQNEKGIEFLKKNLILIIGMISVVGIYFMLPDFTIYKYLPFLMNEPFIFFINLRWIFLLCIYYSSLFILYVKNK